MLKNRVIPCLLIQNGRLVKTHQFSKPTYIGDPINAIKIFNEKEVDELLLLDIDASKGNKEPDYTLIEQVAGECFMPLAYGGGISNFQQAEMIFSLGVEKICLRTAAFKDMSLISMIADKYGSQSIIVSIDVKKNLWGRRCLLSSVKKHRYELFEFVNKIVGHGAGELMLMSVEHDGVMNGMDLELIKSVSRQVSVPLIAAGGVGSLHDIKQAIESGADAVAAGSFFVYQGPLRGVLITYPEYAILEKLLV